MTRWIVLLSTQLAFSAGALAEPPVNFDATLAPWFRSLMAPNGSGCCTIADCHRASFRTTPAGYEALIDDKWVSVPWERVLRRTDNPTGQAILCNVPHTEIILCFVRPSDS
jgi:hypothetical protein